MKRFILFFCTISLMFAACKKKEDITSFKWLEGSWVGKYDSVPVFEQWKPAEKTIMFGRGGVLNGKDTVFTEKVQLEEREDGIYYIAMLKDNPGATEFKFSGFKNDTAVFENPSHDFPQRVLYFKNNDGTFYAGVDGKFSGKYIREGFVYRRTNDW